MFAAHLRALVSLVSGRQIPSWPPAAPRGRDGSWLAQSVIGMAIRTSIIEKGPTVISIPGDVAAADAVGEPAAISIPAPPVLRPSNSDLSRLIEMINEAGTVAIFGGDGCRDARDEVVDLAARLKAPVGYALRGKQWLEHDNPYAVGLTGLLG